MTEGGGRSRSVPPRLARLLRARPCGRSAPPDTRRRFPPCSTGKIRCAGSLQPSFWLAALTVGVDVTVHADRFRFRAERELVAQVIAV